MHLKRLFSQYFPSKYLGSSNLLQLWHLQVFSLVAAKLHSCVLDQWYWISSTWLRKLNQAGQWLFDDLNWLIRRFVSCLLMITLTNRSTLVTYWSITHLYASQSGWSQCFCRLRSADWRKLLFWQPTTGLSWALPWKPWPLLSSCLPVGSANWETKLPMTRSSCRQLCLYSATFAYSWYRCQYSFAS